MHRIEATHVDGEAYALEVRGRTLLVEQPETAGGQGTAPTPTELFAASPATRVAFHAGRCLTRHRVCPRRAGGPYGVHGGTCRPSRITLAPPP
ncbi:hypothetical protein ACRJ4W_23650 [Streptomyces sp. GLT-R25]